jgi:hypothetical protein
MTFDETLATLRGWLGDDVVVELEPEGTVMRGRLSELDAAGVDGALFALDRERTSGVALALFRDGVTAAGREDDRLVVRQGAVTATVYLCR